MKLISVENDPKTSKSVELGYLTAIMYLAPYTLSGKNICPMADTAQCHVPCLNTAGHGAFNSVQRARLLRTTYYHSKRNEFFTQLHKEIVAFLRKCDKRKLRPAIRLNGTSDIRWENYDVIQRYPDVQFYDYTKIPNRKALPANYDLTWSYSEASRSYAALRPAALNWAVVFGSDLPSEFLGRPVIDGDAHDLRFLDPKGVIVGLKAKGRARRDKSGFVIR